MIPKFISSRTFILIAGIVAVALMGTFLPRHRNVEPKINTDYVTFEKGKYVGRNAMMIYLGKTHKSDTIKIEILDLLKIEDSLTNLK